MVRTPLLSAAALAAALAIAGCGGGGLGSGTPGGPTVDTEAPSISNPRLSATTLDFQGGPVTVAVEVTDPAGVQSVIAIIRRAGSSTSNQLSLSPAGGATYQGSYTVPANQTPGGQAISYTVSIRATDARGNVSDTITVGTVTVSGPDGDSPPPAPPTWP